MANATLDSATPLPQTAAIQRMRFDTLLGVGYGVALLASLSIWFLAVRAPLWTDETLSYWQIAGGFKQIWGRSVEGNSFAAYAYILWLTKALFGVKEVILRVPSILAMIASVYVFYRCARELFDWDVSLIATLFFVLPRLIAFAAIDVRPYAFAVLMTNLTILAFLRWTKTHRTAYAALLGVAAAGIFYFQYLFGCILLALAVYYLLTSRTSLRADLPQIGITLGCFAVVILPVLPRLKYIYQTRTTHSFTKAPEWTALLQVLHPGKGQLFVLVGFVLLAVVARRLMTPDGEALRKLLLVASLALVPVLCLYVVSVTTPLHVFIPRYLLVAVPGIALCWGWLCSVVESSPLRATFCFTFVALCLSQAYTSPAARLHNESWKESLAYADDNAAEDHAPLLMCSPFVEGDFQQMPADPRESMLYAPLSYYKVSARVVPLPGSLNDEAERAARQFLLKAAPEHQRFLVLAALPSLRVVDYVAYYSQSTHSPRVLATFDEIWVVEFTPRDSPGR